MTTKPHAARRVHPIMRVVCFTCACALVGVAFGDQIADMVRSRSFSFAGTASIVVVISTAVTLLISEHVGIPSRIAMIFAYACGTTLIIILSMGRQGDALEARALHAKVVNAEIADVKAERKRNVAMLAEEQGKHARQCTGDKLTTAQERACKQINSSVSVYRSAVVGNDATLKRLGEQLPETSIAGHIAGLLELFGADARRVERIAQRMLPVAMAAFCEILATMLLHIAFRASSAKAPEPVAPQQPAPVALLTVSDEKPIAKRRAKRSDADLIETLRSAGRPMTIAQLAEAMRCEDDTVHRRIKASLRKVQVEREGRSHRMLVSLR